MLGVNELSKPFSSYGNIVVIPKDIKNLKNNYMFSVFLNLAYALGKDIRAIAEESSFRSTVAPAFWSGFFKELTD
jgi:hypothetical protein